jgi:hypothetical protein
VKCIKKTAKKLGLRASLHKFEEARANEGVCFPSLCSREKRQDDRVEDGMCLARLMLMSSTYREMAIRKLSARE